MTNWEQQQIFSRLDRIIELLEGRTVEEPKVNNKKAVAQKAREKFNSYVENGGTLSWNEWRHMVKETSASTDA